MRVDIVLEEGLDEISPTSLRRDVELLALPVAIVADILDVGKIGLERVAEEPFLGLVLRVLGHIAALADSFCEFC